MHTIFLLFPHQLFKEIALLKQAETVYLIEEYLFFNQYKFHKQKLLLHRASMKYYEKYLLDNEVKVRYVEAQSKESDVRVLLNNIGKVNTYQIAYYDVCDNWLNKRITYTCESKKLKTTEYPTPLFLNTKEDLASYFDKKTKYFQTDFYIQQRKKFNILLDEKGKPVGGKWSFDAENRLKYPKNKKPPKVVFPIKNEFQQEAHAYVQRHYAANYGTVSDHYRYPCTHSDSVSWLNQFLENRFSEFGEYEDAMVEEEDVLHHSVFTPLLNIGLLLPMQIIEAALAHAEKNNIPLNSLEGFIRQIIGWREFIRGVYLWKGTLQRKTNFWNFSKSLPNSFYEASTGIAPIDSTISKLLKTGYNHHIERLMILGNFMVLSEFNPEKVYQWFMEMYIDAYDWVMVPNVYGMSQFADGGLMATKPYISGSSYILKMSNFEKGDWCAVWDAFFWHFMNKHRNFFLSNPRLGMLVKTYDKMIEDKKQAIQQIFENSSFNF